MNSLVVTMENLDDSLSQDVPTPENEDHHLAHDDTTRLHAPDPDDDESAQRNTRAREVGVTCVVQSRDHSVPVTHCPSPINHAQNDDSCMQ